ncbi:MAG: galactose-1-phosphate uridylyltransferase [Acidobacteria bacterium]|nr:MAG: galactose-1-phosphate uridylyltransferase [Acidobacteriota bacterium]
MLDLKRHPHRRCNRLTGDWVLVSPHRTDRPWQGQIEDEPPESLHPYDPKCYLCPGNERAGGVHNPNYSNTFVFDNDFSALRADTPPETFVERDLIAARGEPGICRVVCFLPRHDLTISRMSIPDIRYVVDTWVEQYQELGSKPFINWVQIFENRGAMMGASNPHPHGQIWANANLPNEPNKEHERQNKHWATHGSCLLCDYLTVEQKLSERLVVQTGSFQALVPFWAVWPFETMILSKRHLSGLDELSEEERDDLARILKLVTTRYDNLFRTSFPYTMGFHQRPTDGQSHPQWHLHIHFFPPLLRSATIKKFMVGYELLATPQRDITAEAAAERLREQPDRHYLEPSP